MGKICLGIHTNPESDCNDIAGNLECGTASSFSTGHNPGFVKMFTISMVVVLDVHSAESGCSAHDMINDKTCSTCEVPKKVVKATAHTMESGMVVIGVVVLSIAMVKHGGICGNDTYALAAVNFAGGPDAIAHSDVDVIVAHEGAKIAEESTVVVVDDKSAKPVGMGDSKVVLGAKSVGGMNAISVNGDAIVPADKTEGTKPNISRPFAIDDMP